MTVLLSLPFYALANSFISTPSLDNVRIFAQINFKTASTQHSESTPRRVSQSISLLPQNSLSKISDVVREIISYKSIPEAAVKSIAEYQDALIGKLADETASLENVVSHKMVLRMPVRISADQTTAAISQAAPPVPLALATTPAISPILVKKSQISPQQNAPPIAPASNDIRAQVNKFLQEYTQQSPVALASLTDDLNNLKALVATLPRSTIVVGRDPAPAIAPAVSGGNISLSQNTITTARGALTITSVAGVTTLGDNVTFGGTTTFNTVTYTWPSGGGSSNQVLQTNGNGGLSWATVAGGSGTQTKDDGIQSLAGATKINFSGNAFTLTSSSSTETIVKIDWTNGPASRSIAQNISGLWTFTGGASFSAPFELSSTASISGAISQNTIASNSFAGSLNTSLGLHSTGNQTTLAQFISTGAGSNSFSGSLTVTKSLTLANTLISSNTGSNSFAGSLNLSKGLVGTVGVFSGTGSNSFSGSVNTAKGIHALDVGITGRFMSSGTGSNSFSGSLDLSKGLRVNAITSATAASNSFAGSINASLGIHATQLTASGLITGTNQLNITGAGSNSFSGSLNTSLGIHAVQLTASGLITGTNQLNITGAGSNSFSGSLNTSLGIHAVQLTASGLITGTNQLNITGTGSNSFSGSLDLSKGLRTLAITSSGVVSSSFAGSITVTKSLTTAGGLIGSSTGSNSFAGSLAIAKGLQLTGVLVSSGTGSNSFSGSLNISKSLTLANTLISSNTGSNSFSGSLTIAKGLQLTGALIGSSTGSNSFAGSLNTTFGVHVAGGFSVINTTATGPAALIQNSSLTSGNLFSLVATTSAFTGNVINVNAKNMSGGTGAVLNFNIPASTSANNQHGIMLVTAVGGQVIASWSMGGKLALRSSILTRGAVSNCTATNAPVGSGCIDYAETYPTQDASIVATDLVSVDPHNSQNVVKATGGSGIVGIVSTNPGALITGQGLLSGAETLNHSNIPQGEVAVALAGRVPVKVSTENGPIKIGDYLRVSPDMPGVAMKARKAGNVVGQALDDYSGSEVGQVMTFIEPGYYNGKSLEDAAGSFDSGSETGLVDALMTQFIHQTPPPSANMSDIVADRIAAAIEIISPKIYGDSIFANKLEARTGITTYDEQTGAPYCISVSGGQLKTTQGLCGSPVSTPLSSSTPTVSPTPTLTDTPSPEATP